MTKCEKQAVKEVAKILGGAIFMSLYVGGAINLAIQYSGWFGVAGIGPIFGMILYFTYLDILDDCCKQEKPKRRKKK